MSKSYQELRERVYEANIQIKTEGLVVLTWGNASAADREQGVFAIKPSGVEYARLSAKDIVILSLEDGSVVEGNMKPSSDTPTHLVLYQGFPDIAGIVHTHSTYAVAWAQAGRDIPVYGSTHADHWAGPIPLVRQLEDREIQEDYEAASGKAIIDSFRERRLDPLDFPGAILPHHGPFCWGQSMKKAVENAIALEEISKMAFLTERISPDAGAIPRAMANKHYTRKHGPGAYYGQGGGEE